MYNFHETGFTVGMYNALAVVTASGRRLRPKSMQQGNWEWVASVVCVSAAGSAIPPFIIFIGFSKNGWTMNELGMRWLEHYDRHTKERNIGSYRLLILDGHESYNSIKFQQYCIESKIVTLSIPLHSSYLLQPLDAGCSSPFKRAYGR